MNTADQLYSCSTGSDDQPGIIIITLAADERAWRGLLQMFESSP